MDAANKISSMTEISNVIRSGSGFEKGTLILAFLLLAFFILFHNLGGAALFEPDEGRNAEVGREILLTGDWVTPHYDFIPRLDKPIFYYWLVAFSFKVFAVSEWSARLPSAVAALACVLLTWGLAVTMFGFCEALWSGLILATSVEFSILSRTVMLDMTLNLFITLSLCAFHWGSTTDQRRIKTVFYLFMYASMGLATLIKGPIGIILPGLVIVFYLFHTRKWYLLNEMNLIVGIPLFLVIAISWYAWAEMRNPGELRYFFVEENILRFFTPRFNRSQPWYYLFSVLVIGFLPWTLLLPFVVEDLWERRGDHTTVFLVIWAFLPLFFFSFSDSKLPHYILPVYSPVSILAGKTLSRMLRDRSGKESWVLALPWLTLATSLLGLVLAAVRPDVMPDRIQLLVRQFAPSIPLSLAWITLLISIVLAGANWRAVWKSPVALYLSYCVGFFLVFLFIHVVVATVSHTRTSKDLAEEAAPLIHPEDTIVVYHGYLSSLPFYLRVERPLWVVWSGNKRTVMGSTYVGDRLPRSSTGDEKVLFRDEEFSKVWRESCERLLLFAHAKHIDRLSAEAAVPFKTLLQVGDMVLLTNR